MMKDASPHARLPAALLAGIVLAASTPAHAAPPVSVDRQVTDGVERPVHDYAATGDASSLELNPALLLNSRGVDLVLRGYARGYDLSRGRGGGGWLSTSLLPSLAFGFGVQHVRPSFGGSRPDFARGSNPNATKISLGMAVGDRESASLGLGIHAVRLGSGWLSRPDLDIGFVVRATNFASIGTSLRLSGGSGGGLRVPTRMSTRTELAIRPLGTSLLEVAGGINTDTVDSDGLGLSSIIGNVSATNLHARGRVGVRWQGVSLSGELEQVTATTFDELTLAPINRDKGVRGSIALGLSWDFATVETGLHVGTSDAVDGLGVMARITSDRLGRVVPTRPVDVERIRLADLQGERDFLALLARLDRALAAGERSILLLDVRNTSAGWSTLLEVRTKLIEVRNAGGHVFAYTEFADLRDLYMASVAEEIFVHPAGEVAPFGIASASFYYKDALARLGVKVEALHVDEFKSAHEPFTRSGRSEADTFQRGALLDDIFGQVVADIAQGRGATLREIRELINTAPFGPEQAVEADLVDTLAYRDQVLEQIAEAVGVDVRFARFPDTAPAKPTWAAAPYVGVVLIEGTIVDGESLSIPLLGINNVGGDTIAKTLRTLREDPACRGIILRVNSPGGSALASDIIWREVDLTRMAHDEDPRKPAVVVSMGDVAASGGYYVAAGARDIFALPTTITGSIGVVSLHFDVSGMLDKFDIQRDTIGRGTNADISRYTPWTDDQRARLQASILRVYELFLERVAKARGMTRDEVHALARGRVYSGIDALEVGLVDELGGIERARARLAERMGRKESKRPLPFRTFPAQRTILDILVDSVTPDWLAGVVERRSKTRSKAARALLSATRADEFFAALPLQVVGLYDGLPATMMDRHIDVD